MNVESAQRAIEMFEQRGQLDALHSVDSGAARACLDRASGRLAAAKVLADSAHNESAYTEAYDAFRTAADAIVLLLGYRVPAVPGGHRVAVDLAHAALKATTDAFEPATAERFRQERHASEYFDPARPVDKTADDVVWAIDRATKAVDAVGAELSAG